jgi:hypothetical protein
VGGFFVSVEHVGVALQEKSNAQGRKLGRIFRSLRSLQMRRLRLALGQKEKAMRMSGMMLQIHQHLSSVRIQELREYSRAMEALLRQESNRIENKLEEEARKLDEEVREQFYEYNSEHYQNLAVHFPNQFRQSLVSAAYTTLENEVVSIANTLGTEIKSKVKVNDFKGDAYSRAKTFLEKVIQLEVDKEAWDSLVHYNLVRNFIVHHAGHLDKKHNKYKAAQGFIEKHPHIEVDNMDGILISSEYIHDYLEKIQSLFNQLLEA